ncbi:hypothetical protein LJC49_04485 [Ruminococcaceae bacterium OttesenSCG-928-I18]|nr:hypothetical protein [Ruminococcaceae bacterium OttesenSCG-928-I18]
MGTYRQYDAKDCTVMVDGVYITGFGEDMVSFEKDEDFVNPVAGAQGDVVANVIHNDICTLTLSVQATSPQKAHLIRLATSKKMFKIWVTNKSIGERFGGNKAMIKTFPELTHGAEAEDREFEISVFDGTIEAI